MATTGHLIEWLAAGVVTTAGVAVASGKVRFYQPATLTPISVYSDDALTAAITQPLTLNAGGAALVYVGPSARMIVKDSTDTTTLYDVTMQVTRSDQVYVTSESFNQGNETTLKAILDGWTTSAGGTSQNFLYARGASNVNRTLKSVLGEDHVSVKDWAVAGDGVTNDTSEIQNAIGQAASEGSGIVYFPPGTYLISSALTVPANVSLVGAGSAVSIIKQSGGAANGILISGAGNNRVQGLQITHSTTSTGIGISCVSSNGISIRDVTFGQSKFATGLKFSACSNTSVYDSSIYGRDTGSGTGRGILYATSGDQHFLSNVTVGADTTGVCIELDTSTNGYTFVGTLFFQGDVGVKVSSSSNDDLMRVMGSFGLASNIATPFSQVAPAARGLFQLGNLVDGYTEDVTSGGTVTPAPLTRGRSIRYRGTTTGSAYVVALPTPPLQRNFQMTIQYFNNAAGAVTGWTHNAGFHLAAAGAISTVNLEKTSVIWEYDIDSAVWREIARAVTT